MGIGPNVLAIKKTIVSSQMWPFYLILLTLLFGLAKQLEDAEPWLGAIKEMRTNLS